MMVKKSPSLSFIGKPFSEKKIFNFAYLYDKVTIVFITIMIGVNISMWIVLFQKQQTVNKMLFCGPIMKNLSLRILSPVRYLVFATKLKTRRKLFHYIITTDKEKVLSAIFKKLLLAV
jgi:hypothetical protein